MGPWIFWMSAAFVAYVYVGYPILLEVWARWSARRTRSQSAIDRTSSELPGVSIVVAARNEAARLGKRVANLLAADYPADRRQIIVVSDGSNDDTPSVLAEFGDEVELVAVPLGGKASALNAGVACARHDILVFADARQTFAPDALRALTAPFVDPRVGGVTGELILGCEAGGRRTAQNRRRRTASPQIERRVGDRRNDGQSSIAEGVGLYWRYEKRLRRLESCVSSTLGATGAIYALRRSLWRPLPAGTILDDVLAPMRAVLAGSRVVFEERARAFDAASLNSSQESRRKVRTLAGNYQILALEPRLLVPVVNPVWIQYVSHKIGRLLTPYALVAMLASSAALAASHPVYLAAFSAQLAFYLLGAYGGWLEATRNTATRAARVAFTFIVMNWAAVAGLRAALSGQEVWRR